jgi:LysR family positive regulator for ilvC
MELYQLTHFLVLSETLHFKNCSIRCNTSPSTISRSIQRLEDEANCALFQRDNRGVVLTPQGRLFREWATSVMDGWKEFQFKILDDSQLLTGEISIYGSVTAYYSIMSPIIEQFRSLYPEIHLRLQTGSPGRAIERIESKEVDLAITMHSESMPGNIQFQKITTTPLSFITSRADMRSEDQIDWSVQPMVLAQEGLARERVNSWFSSRGISPDIYAQVEGNEAILAMVSMGCGIGVVPYLVLEKSPLKKTIRVIEMKSNLEPYEIGLIAHKVRMQNPLVARLWDLVAKS